MAAVSLFWDTNMAAISLFWDTNMAAISLFWDTNMAAISLFWDANMAAVTSCENTLFAQSKLIQLLNLHAHKDDVITEDKKNVIITIITKS